MSLPTRRIDELTPVPSLLGSALLEIQQGTSFRTTADEILALQTVNNVGGGAEIAQSFTSNVYSFRSLLEGDSIVNIVQNTNDVTFSINPNSITNAELLAGVFGAIVGLGVQTQNLDMGTNSIVNASNVAGSTATFTASLTTALINITNAGAGANPTLSSNSADQTLLVGGNIDIDTNFLQLEEITLPSNPPADNGLVYVRDLAGVTTLFFLDSAGTETNLLLGGGGGGAINSINGDTTPAQILAGTANRLSIADAGATHTFDIDAAYAGQASITTLGTITTGVWNGTDIAYANIQNVVGNLVVLGNISGAGSPIEELDGADVTALLNVFTSALQGVAPASGGGTVNFLRADGTWAIPPGGSGGAIDTINGNNNPAQLITGVANRISIDSVTTPGTTEIDIDSAYVGQTSITTLGTIATGVWNGTAIASANIVGTLDGKILTNQDNIVFAQTSGAPANSTFAMYRSTADDLVINIPTVNDSFRILVNGVLRYNITDASFDITGRPLELGSNFTIAQSGLSMNFNAPSRGAFAFIVDGNTELSLAAGSADFAGNSISNAVVGPLSSLDDCTVIDGLNYNAGIKQTFNPNATNAGINVGSVATQPTSPADGDIIYNTTSNDLEARVNGAWVSLTAGGGGVTNGSNVGTGIGVFDGLNGTVMEFNALNGGVGITVADAAPGITISINSSVARLDAAQVWGDFNQTFRDRRIIIRNPANTFGYTIEAAAITGNITLNLPLSTAEDTLASVGVSNAWGDGVTQTFNPNGTSAGINVGAHDVDPGTPNNGDLYYNSTSEELRARINGAWVALGGGAAGNGHVIEDEGTPLTQRAALNFIGTIVTATDNAGTDASDVTIAIPNGHVTNAMLADMTAPTIKGRTTAGSGSPEDLTTAQATAMLDVFTSALQGLVPGSGGGTTNFLRADGTWAAPPGGGGTISGLTIDATKDWGGIFGINNLPFLAIGTTAIANNKILTVQFADDTGGAGVRYQNSDGRFDFLNGTGTANEMQPTIRGLSSTLNTIPGIIIDGTIPLAADTASSAAVIKLRAFKDPDATAAAIVNRDILQIENIGTILFEMDVDGNVDRFASYTNFAEISTPATPAVDNGRLYAADLGGVSKPFWIDSTGATFDLSLAPPFTDSVSIVRDVGDSTKQLRLDVGGNTTGITGTLSTSFTTNKNLAIPDSGGSLVATGVANTYTTGEKQTVDSDASSAGLRDIGNAGDPSTLEDGDIWHNTVLDVWRARLNGATQSFAYLGLAQTWSALQTFNNDAIRLNPAAGDPASPLDGQLWYNSTTDKLRGRENGVSVDLVSNSLLNDPHPCIMEVAQGTGAYHNIHPLDTQVSKISGFIMPSDVDSTINFKVEVPSQLASSPNAKIRFRTLTLSANTSDNVNMTVSTRFTGDGENADQAFNVNVAATNYALSDTIESIDVHEAVLPTQPEAGDTITGQLFRDVSADDAGNVLIIGIDLIIDRVLV